jgi:DNA-binding CsgD family transcriptional regulator/ligand-binding sensor domain-containing protein
LFGQELPPIERYTPEEYKGDNQNWMISQDKNGYIYVANNKGLLEYNGAVWNVFPSPNNTIIRAVKVINNRIYTGCYAEFGYWQKNELGTLEYNSLLPQLANNKLEDEQVWNIIEYNEWVIFQSNRTLYFYNTLSESFKIVSATNIIYKIFKVNNQIYFHVANEGIYNIVGGQPELIVDDPIILSERVISLFEKDKKLVILTRNAGYYIVSNGKVIPLKTEADSIFPRINIFSFIQLQDGSFVLGTISDGIFHLDQVGNIKYQITQKKGLGNNTVLSLFEDNSNNVWSGLDNGIVCINVNSAIKTFYDYEGKLGTVYSTQLFNDILYIGSNQGLFYKHLNSDSESFEFIEGTAGQVWSLFNYKNETLFCGHHLGTFVIDGKKANKISNTLGAWIFKTIPNRQGKLIQGNYDGLYILEKKNGQWSTKNKIEGFKNSSRYVEFHDYSQVWVNHEYKGVFKLKLDDSLTHVVKLEMESSLPLGKNSSLVKYKNKILYASESGVYNFNETSKSFQRDSLLTNLLKKTDLVSGKLIVDNNERLWAFSEENIKFIENDLVTNKPQINSIPIPSKLRKGVLGFENISLVDKDKYIIGTANGYMTLNLTDIKKSKKYDLSLNSVVLKDLDDRAKEYPIASKSVFNFNQGILVFKYSVPGYEKHIVVKYQYKLEPFQKKWSHWSEDSEVTFENLPFGDYTLLVRAKVGNELTENTLSYEFKINRPWYLSDLALIIYSLLLITTIIIVHKTYKSYYLKKFEHEKLEKEQIIMQINNEKLNQKIESKNRELAISTMSIIKKNEVLNTIKRELKKSNQANNNAAISLIDSNLNDAKDWSLFEQAFNNVDKDFLDKINLVHPDLTPNDLRFCAYLRLNLSSKEIAPLLNISIKSVETKRYRLRKKLGLEHDKGLVNYIIKF